MRFRTLNRPTGTSKGAAPSARQCCCPDRGAGARGRFRGHGTSYEIMRESLEGTRRVERRLSLATALAVVVCWGPPVYAAGDGPAATADSSAVSPVDPGAESIETTREAE